MMIKCRTELKKDTIKALARYHIANNKKIKRSRGIAFAVAILLLVASLINAYGIWQKYYGTESIVVIFVRAFLFVFLSLLILFSVLKGREHNLKRELAKYFEQTNTKHLDYVISNEGIRLIIDEKETMFGWNEIEKIKSDDKYYYFSSNGRHSIIAKEDISTENVDKMDCLLKRCE